MEKRSSQIVSRPKLKEAVSRGTTRNLLKFFSKLTTGEKSYDLTKELAEKQKMKNIIEQLQV